MDVESTKEASAAAAKPGERAADVMERLISAADVSKVYAEPIVHGDRLLLPAAEVLAVAGFGIGSGGGAGLAGRTRASGGGGGGGGQALARGVAVIVSSPEGVSVRPVFDYTKIALAALTAAGFVWASWKAMARPKRFRR
ncbi:MAG: hypothetical protein ACM3SU_16160 [Acidobacteriota bacterium]